MRPIVMDMHGFASFREQTRVDFTDADFFALVGPTGAGKSTVIDAMTFALYGSVPRWGRKGMVSLALAPTVARATVKLVFEVDRQRYVVARELRRMGAQVSQRAATLERILDPNGLADKDDKTAPMAKDLAGVNDAVERLLGLSYEDFIQCVVLPQGQFADFLHAKPGDRQAILLRLLGAEHYKQMMMKANQRAGAAAQRAETIGESLFAYADATEDAEMRSREAEAALAALAQRVAEILPRIGEHQRELSAAEDRLQRLRADQALLSALRVPDGISALDAALVSGRTDVAVFRNAEQEAEAADTTARESLAAAPQRAPLELARERRTDWNRLRESLPSLEAEASRLTAHAHAASAAVETGTARLEEFRVHRDDAARNAKDAGELVNRLQREHDALAAVTAPDSITAIDERRQTAATTVADATRKVSEAEQRDTDARSARDGAISEVALAQATRDLRELQGLLTDLEAASDALKRARDAQIPADTALSKATEALSRQRDALEAAQREHVIAGLRPHLVAGEACPLCEQTVTVLPGNISMTEVDDARSSLAEAEKAEKAARRAAANAVEAVARAEAELKTKVTREIGLLGSLRDALIGPLVDAPMADTRLIAATDMTGERWAHINPALVNRALAETAALIREREVLDRAVKKAADETEDARARYRDAQAAERAADAEVSNARVALRQARDPLVQLGAPQVDDASLTANWTALITWAEEQQRTRATDLAAARQTAATADGQHRVAATDFAKAEEELGRQRADANAAVRADQQAKAKLEQVTERLGKLGELLRDAPDDSQIAEQLVLLGQLEDASAKAGQALRAARAERAKGETALAALERGEREARTELSAARDRVVALGAAPAVDALGLHDSWHALMTWAADQAASRERQAGQATADVATATDAVRQLTGRLSADLAENGIELAPDSVAVGAASAVAAALEHARGATARLSERRAEATGLRSRQQAAQAEQQVAGMLGDLLRADNFQRWLVNAAADDLVAEASTTLSALSSGQFDLVYDDGDFYVIDHSDADARRSVRTLSGGETFQASLALALALSSQVSALAAAGAAHLDSIFLDEGFGTLDPETLEVVATTLETLAQGERMVGVVTHVAALAERVPVRFRVTRNARTSTIVREGLEVAAEDEVMA
jgi:exonuclease SbcC